MGGLFSKKKPKQSSVTSKDRAVLDLKIARDKTQQFKRKVRWGHAQQAATMHG